ncbi:MAG: site-specific DNA-methyltransferase [Candidatus Moranbacteria bacterium]|nr:site-specific DNA-methyltransferase [Candidatus Moranbacteria bacterium]
MAKTDYSSWDRDQLLAEVNKLASRKKYGLVWEEKKENVVERCQKELPVLEEVGEKAIFTDPTLSTSLMIEGDNYHSLSVLNYTHKEKIDVIYIDPPYNTGNKDFIYNDGYVDKEDGFRHSKWLSFIEKRLRLSKSLLKRDGIIFISINDIEQANLKILCDEIFGENNFIAQIPRVTKKAGKSTIGVAKNHDYVISYAKDVSLVNLTNPPHQDKEYKYKDEHFLERGPYKLNQTLDYDTLGYVNSLDYLIEFEGNSYYPGKVSEENFLIRKSENPKDGFRWRWSPKKVAFGIQNDWLQKSQKRGDRLYTKTYLNAQISKNKQGIYYIEYINRSSPLLSLALVDNKYSNDNAKKELERILGKGKFDYPKPTSLIQTLLTIVNSKELTILDFFAGSGTTGQAVLELNQIDKGSRKFILCTNNGDEKSEHGIAVDICYPRMKKVIKGYKNQKGEKVEGLGGNLKYFKTNFISKEKVSDDTRRNLVKRSTEMICVREGIYEKVADNVNYKIFSDKKKSVGILFSLKKIDEFKAKIEKLGLPVNMYIFSLTSDTYSEDFSDLTVRYSIVPIPESILDVYRKLFK